MMPAVSLASAVEVEYVVVVRRRWMRRTWLVPDFGVEIGCGASEPFKLIAACGVRSIPARPAVDRSAARSPLRVDVGADA